MGLQSRRLIMVMVVKITGIILSDFHVGFRLAPLLTAFFALFDELELEALLFDRILRAFFRLDDFF